MEEDMHKLISFPERARMTYICKIATKGRCLHAKLKSFLYLLYSPRGMRCWVRVRQAKSSPYVCPTRSSLMSTCAIARCQKSHAVTLCLTAAWLSAGDAVIGGLAQHVLCNIEWQVDRLLCDELHRCARPLNDELRCDVCQISH